MIDKERACRAAEEANKRFGQWMPERWLYLFMDAYNATHPIAPVSDYINPDIIRSLIIDNVKVTEAKVGDTITSAFLDQDSIDAAVDAIVAYCRSPCAPVSESELAEAWNAPRESLTISFSGFGNSPAKSGERRRRGHPHRNARGLLRLRRSCERPRHPRPLRLPHCKGRMMDRTSMRLMGWALVGCAIFSGCSAVIVFRLLLSVNDFYPAWKPTVSGTVLMLGAMCLSVMSVYVLSSSRALTPLQRKEITNAVGTLEAHGQGESAKLIRERMLGDVKEQEE